MMNIHRLDLSSPSELGFEEHEALVRRLYGKWSQALSKADWYNDERVLSLLDPIAALRPKHVLELCAGSGIVLERLAKRMPETQFLGVDISPAMCSNARGRCRELANVRLVEGDWLQAVPRGFSFDVIIVKNSLHLLRDLHEKLKALHEVSKVDTKLVVVETVAPTKTSLQFVEGLFKIVDRQHVKRHFFVRPLLLSILTKAGWGARQEPKVVNQMMSVDKWLAFKADGAQTREQAFRYVTRASRQIREEMAINSHLGLFMLRRQLVAFNSPG